MIRHIYDLSIIHAENPLGNNFFGIIKKIISQDAKQFKNQHREYFVNPIQEIQHSLSVLKSNAEWEKHYYNFLEAMVYDKNPACSYQETVLLLETLTNKIINSIE